MLLSGLVSIYPGLELADGSALLALQQQGYGGPMVLWFGCLPLLFRLVWTTSCKERSSGQIKDFNDYIYHHTTNTEDDNVLDFVKTLSQTKGSVI